jgi:hypothetical protein
MPVATATFGGFGLEPNTVGSVQAQVRNYGLPVGSAVVIASNSTVTLGDNPAIGGANPTGRPSPPAAVALPKAPLSPN